MKCRQKLLTASLSRARNGFRDVSSLCQEKIPRHLQNVPAKTFHGTDEKCRQNSEQAQTDLPEIAITGTCSCALTYIPRHFTKSAGKDQQRLE
jgi:hypothetical protein